MTHSPKTFAVDANVWMDLAAGGILEIAFQLPWKFVMTDLLWHDIQHDPDPEALERFGVKVMELSGPEVLQLALLVARYPRPSRCDLSALVLAKSRQIGLLTGDKDLREAAAREGVECHGTLYVVRAMLERRLITPAEAKESFERMRTKARRLPWDKCTQLIKEYEGLVRW